MMRTPRRVNIPVRTLWVISLTAAMWGLGGCHGGTLWGAGIGALFGQAIGGDTESTVAGAAIGALIGGSASHDQYSSSHYNYQPHVNYAPTPTYYAPAPTYHVNHVHYGGDCY